MPYGTRDAGLFAEDVAGDLRPSVRFARSNKQHQQGDETGHTRHRHEESTIMYSQVSDPLTCWDLTTGGIVTDIPESVTGSRSRS